MMDSAPFPIGRHVSGAARGASPAQPDPGAVPGTGEQLWTEHGWGLSGSAVAAMVGAIVAASGIILLLG